jgi:uncharacterized protein DUF5655/uncharacterized protein DUF4287
MAMTPAQMVEAVTRNLAKNTGKTAAEWAALLKKDGPGDAKAQYKWLREKHHLGHVAAKILSGQLKAYEDTDALVDKQYSGKAAPLRPLYEAVLKAAKKLGKDVEARPCKTYVPLHRKNTFAVLKPGPGRVDVGLVLGKTAPAGRLEKAKHLGSDRITHKIEVRSKKDIDAELLRWLRKAYAGV